MTLITKLSTLKLVNPEGNRIILKDSTGTYGETTYTLEDDTYVSSLNSTGYGDVNPVRETIANFPIGFIKKMNGDERVEFESYSSLASMEYNAIVDEDGWYSFNLISVPLVEDFNTLEIDECGYDIETGSILKRTETGGLSSVEPWDLLHTVYSSATVEQLFLANISVKKSEINDYLIGLYKGDISINKPAITKAQHQFNVIRTILTGSIYEYCRGNKYNAQSNIEYLNKYITDIVYGL
jgi:hypothetical protein